MRYEVTEIEGFLTGLGRGSNASPGLSTHIVDTLWNRRILGTWRTEDYAGTVVSRRALVRNLAARRAATLNGSTPPPSVDTCRNGHPRTPENVHTRSDGRTECLACRKAWYAAR